MLCVTGLLLPVIYVQIYMCSIFAVHMYSTGLCKPSSIIIHYIGQCCHSPNPPRKYSVLSENSVFSFATFIRNIPWQKMIHARIMCLSKVEQPSSICRGRLQTTEKQGVSEIKQSKYNTSDTNIKCSLAYLTYSAYMQFMCDDSRLY